MNKEDMVRKVSKDTKYSPDVVREITESLLGNVVSATVGGERKREQEGTYVQEGRCISRHMLPRFSGRQKHLKKLYTER